MTEPVTKALMILLGDVKLRKVIGEIEITLNEVMNEEGERAGWAVISESPNTLHVTSCVPFSEAIQIFRHEVRTIMEIFGDAPNTPSNPPTQSFLN